MNKENTSELFHGYSEYISYQVEKCLTPVDHPYYQGVRDSHLKIINKFLSNFERDALILDCGCGYGFALSAFQECEFSNVIGTDVSEHRLSVAKTIGYPIRNVDMHDMSTFPGNQFDIVYSSHALEHALYPENVLNEIHRVLKPEGTFILVLPYPVQMDDDHVRKAHCGAEALGLTRIDDGRALIQTVENFGFSLTAKSVGSYRDESEIYLKFSKGTANSALIVESYGPNSAKAGMPFNEQPDGSSAFWFIVEDPYQSELVVEFDGLFLKTARVDNLITATIPASLLQSPHTAQIRIVDEIRPQRFACLEFCIKGSFLDEHVDKKLVQTNSHRKPNFFIVGAPRSGTTSMYWQLRSHSDIFMPRIKEPFFFDDRAHGVLSETVSVEAEYMNLFKFAPFQVKMIGEASTSYLSSPEALRAIRTFNPAAKIIVMLRNPLEASISMYLQTKKGGKYEFEASFEQAWQACHTKVDRVFMTNYPKLFLIGDQMNNALSIFGKDLKVIIFDDIVRDSVSVYVDVLNFLGLEANALGPIPVSNSAEWNNIHSVAPDYLIEEMIEHFRKQVEIVSACLGRNLNHWLIPR